MDKFKLTNFKKLYGFQIPTLRHLTTKESEIIIEKLCSIYRVKKIKFVLEKIYNTFTPIKEINCEVGNFHIVILFVELGITVPEKILINWDKFEDIDCISFDVFNKYFSDIWYPVIDDIEIFDKELKWIISIRHDGIISYSGNVESLNFEERKNSEINKKEKENTNNTVINTNEDIWIGLLQVSNKSENGILGSSLGAYVNVLALAKNSNEFINKVKEAINELYLDFIDIEEMDLFTERKKKYIIDNNIIRLSKEVVKYKELRFGDFHTYE